MNPARCPLHCPTAQAIPTAKLMPPIQNSWSNAAVEIGVNPIGTLKAAACCRALMPGRINTNQSNTKMQATRSTTINAGRMSWALWDMSDRSVPQLWAPCSAHLKPVGSAEHLAGSGGVALVPVGRDGASPHTSGDFPQHADLLQKAFDPASHTFVDGIGHHCDDALQGQGKHL
jgi:hypothetical protein